MSVCVTQSPNHDWTDWADILHGHFYGLKWSHRPISLSKICFAFQILKDNHQTFD